MTAIHPRPLSCHAQRRVSRPSALWREGRGGSYLILVEADLNDETGECAEPCLRALGLLHELGGTPEPADRKRRSIFAFHTVPFAQNNGCADLDARTVGPALKDGAGALRPPTSTAPDEREQIEITR